jgi:arsenate reductase-like glutaredoxin family protein
MTVREVNEVFRHIQAWDRFKILDQLSKNKFCEIIKEHQVTVKTCTVLEDTEMQTLNTKADELAKADSVLDAIYA